MEVNVQQHADVMMEIDDQCAERMLRVSSLTHLTTASPNQRKSCPHEDEDWLPLLVIQFGRCKNIKISMARILVSNIIVSFAMNDNIYVNVPFFLIRMPIYRFLKIMLKF
ncbi:hypothetical protein Pfo_006604 [Paulownia fortunei]|nr:hypothetical protein Pfo_006604 [Paulownia fortunei]